MSERWRILSVQLDYDFGVSYPSRWTVELEGWQGTPPPVGGYLTNESPAVAKRCPHADCGITLAFVPEDGCGESGCPYAEEEA